jgi:hypothetical protein
MGLDEDHARDDEQPAGDLDGSQRLAVQAPGDQRAAEAAVSA